LIDAGYPPAFRKGDRIAEALWRSFAVSKSCWRWRVSDLKIFSLGTGGVKQFQSSDAPIEKSLQNLLEANLEALLGIRFLETVYSRD